MLPLSGVLWNVHGDASAVSSDLCALQADLVALNEVYEGSLRGFLAPMLTQAREEDSEEEEEDEASLPESDSTVLFAPCKPGASFGNGLIVSNSSRQLEVVSHSVRFLEGERSALHARIALRPVAGCKAPVSPLFGLFAPPSWPFREASETEESIGSLSSAGRYIDVFVTHLDHRSEELRVLQVEQLLEFVGECRKTTFTSEPDNGQLLSPLQSGGALLLADWNSAGDVVRSESPSAVEVLLEHGWVDSWVMSDRFRDLESAAARRGFTAPALKSVPARVRIDIPFASCDWALPFAFVEVLQDTFSSDHFPVVFGFESFPKVPQRLWSDPGEIDDDRPGDRRPGFSSTRAVVAAGVFRGTTGATKSGEDGAAVVLVRGDRIAAVYDGQAAIFLARSVDAGVWPVARICSSSSSRATALRGFILPGFIDCHVHPFIARASEYQLDHLRNSSAFKCLRGLRVVQDMLRCGWTTIRVAGDADRGYGVSDLRRSIDEGFHKGPRIVGACHYLTTTGGGADIHWMSAESRCGGSHADGRVVDGVEACRLAVREEVMFGSDWIKILLTGAYMTSSPRDSVEHVHFSPDELDAIVSEAQARGVPVMAHAHGAVGIERALRAGVRSVEHATFIDERGLAALRERVLSGDPAWLVPTLLVGEIVRDDDEGSATEQPDLTTPPAQLAKMAALQKATRSKHAACLRAAIADNAPIALGTDFVGGDVRNNVREFALMVEAGLSPEASIRAGTVEAATLLGLQDEIGSLRPGMCADLVLLAEDPIRAGSETGAAGMERALRSVELVLRGGMRVSSPP
jgi:imidazolonepropionase-like amidohydrolase